jgi:hypothetical protein
MKRRGLLMGLAGGAGLLVAGVAFLSRWTGSWGSEPHSPLASELRSQFSYLQLEPDVIDSFVRDFEAAHGPWLPTSDASPFMRFLASTDFFQTGADESRPPRYVAFYDPYRSPCYNPFATPS